MANVGSRLARSRRVLVLPASLPARRLDDRSKILCRVIGYFPTDRLRSDSFFNGRFSFRCTVYPSDTVRASKYADARLSSDIEENFYSSNVEVLSCVRFNFTKQPIRGSARDRSIGNSRSHFFVARQSSDQRSNNSPLCSIEDKTPLRSFFSNW